MKKEYFVLGVMSGTSLDGIDLAYVKFELKEGWDYRILSAETIEYPVSWRKVLAEAVSFSESELIELNIDYTKYLGGVIREYLKREEISVLDAICSHGHTIKHEPENGFTLQIGNLPLLADLVQETVVCDFRVQDVQLGGQGAPLVPIGDEKLFSDYQYCLNLGGFANISTIIKGRRVAFDICAVNTVLNYLAEQLGLPYDKGGELAALGELDEALLAKLNALDFYSEEPPKSLGIEWVKKHIFPMLQDYVEIKDALHTYVIHIAIQLSSVLDQKPMSKVLVTGGGAFNHFLIRELKGRTRNIIHIPSPETVNFKEALIFAFLGVLRLRNEINVLSSVTGAKKDHSSGAVYVNIGSGI